MIPACPRCDAANRWDDGEHVRCHCGLAEGVYVDPTRAALQKEWDLR